MQRGVNPVVQSSIPRGRIFLLVGVIFAWLAAYCMALFRQRMARAEPLLSLHAFFFSIFSNWRAEEDAWRCAQDARRLECSLHALVFEFAW